MGLFRAFHSASEVRTRTSGENCSVSPFTVSSPGAWPASGVPHANGERQDADVRLGAHSARLKHAAVWPRDDRETGDETIMALKELAVQKAGQGVTMMEKLPVKPFWSVAVTVWVPVVR
jgi:hypothetical protein